jgi:hypothetical protein
VDLPDDHFEIRIFDLQKAQLHCVCHGHRELVYDMSWVLLPEAERPNQNQNNPNDPNNPANNQNLMAGMSGGLVNPGMMNQPGMGGMGGMPGMNQGGYGSQMGGMSGGNNQMGGEKKDEGQILQGPGAGGGGQDRFDRIKNRGKAPEPVSDFPACLVTASSDGTCMVRISGLLVNNNFKCFPEVCTE